jgi:hypothetical protein
MGEIKVGIIEISVFAYLAVLLFLARRNFRRVSRSLKKNI